MADSTDQYEAGAMVRRAIDVLCDEFSGIFSPESVDRYVMESFESLKKTVSGLGPARSRGKTP